MEHAHGAGRAASAPRRPVNSLIAAVAWTGGGVFVASLVYFLYQYGWRFGVPAAGGSVLRPVAVNAVLFSAFALHHSLFARTGAKAWIRGFVPPMLERSIYTWLASLLFIGVCRGWRPVPGTLYAWEPPWHPIAYAIQFSGLVLTFLGARALDVLDLAGIRGVLRADAAPAHVPLSTTGVFGMVRHPLYFGWTLLVWGAADMTATRAAFAVISCAYVALAIVWEETGLIEAFGADYEAYRRRVRWRMIPFVY